MTAPVTNEMKRAFTIDAWNGMIEDVRKTLEEHPEAVKWVDARNGMTALHCAAAQCKTDVILLLLSKGADVDARDDKRRTPLMFGAGNGGRDHVEALLAAGADITLRDEEGQDALAHTEGLSPQPVKAALLRNHAQKLEEKQRLDEQFRKAADIEGAGAAMHSGAEKPVAVSRPLRLKAPGA